MNPFVLPERGIGDTRPLCPWASPLHNDYYTPVDNTQTAFGAFKAAIAAKPALVPYGRAVLVSGGQGCGKTALIHRCASWLRQSLMHQVNTDVLILDLTLEGINGIDTAGRIQHICSRVVDELELRTVFGQSELTALDKRREDAPKAYPYLGQILANNSKALAVLLPPLEVPDELRRYAALAKQHLVFFCESSYDSVAEYCVTSLGPASTTPVLHLSVGVLSVEDGWRFVESRVRRVEGLGIPMPTVTEDTIRRLMEARIKGRGKTNMRELQMACLNVFEEAISRTAPSVEYADFTDYYTQRGSVA